MYLDNMQKEYTFADMEGKSDAEVTAMLKHNKTLDGWVDPNEKVEFVSSGLSLRDSYIEPPFSVLDGRRGEWLARKRKWLDLGIKSEVGRDVEVLIGRSELDYMPEMKTSISVFDPALCELMYTWFCPKDGDILDPFAGGSVRGIVASKMGHKYVGIELRQEQVDSNIQQAKELLGPNDPMPTWICGDSDKVLDDFVEKGKTFEMIFTCPPYFDLEVYSSDPNDLSNMDYESSINKYAEIIRKAHICLEPGGFEIYVVGDVRDKRGFYRDFVGDTRKILMDPFKVGAKYYNDIILLDPVGTAMIRAHNVFSTKKVVKVHQNVLCFKKMGPDDK